MSPRGLAIPNVREQLFQAAERLLLREDAAPLSGRAITREAGCAAGLLYNHFGDFETFLGEMAVDRLRRYASRVADLPARAGAGTVTGNLTDAALCLFEPAMLALSRLTASRPSVLARAIHARSAGRPQRPVLEDAFATYLERERALGRVAADTDTEAIAIALVALVHQLLLMPGPDPHDMLPRVVAAVVAGIERPGQ
jgi:AcrR family transcriptional regulator